MTKPLTRKADLLVRHIAQKNLHTCSPSTHAASILQTMSRRNIGCMVVCENHMPIGVITRRDMIRLALLDKLPNEVHASVLMSTPVKTVVDTTSVDDAGLKFITENVRHLVVVDEQGTLSGIISETDVVNSQEIEHDLFLRSVIDVANLSPIRISSTRPLREALVRLAESHQTAVLVTEDNRIKGILTERDIVSLLARNKLDVLTGECCSDSLVTIEKDLSLYNARKVFHEHQFHHLAITDETGDVTGLVSYNDILRSVETDYVYRLRELLNERDQALEQSQHNLMLAERVIAASMEAIIITDRFARIQSINPAFTDITGYEEHEVLGQNPNMLSSGRHDDNFYQAMWKSLNEQGFWQGEIWNRRKDGSVYPEWLSISAITDDTGEITQYASIFSDLTEVKKSEARIKRLAYFDELTRLPNRKLFNDRLQLSLGYAREHNHRVAVAFIDMDFFQQINDLHGHEAGDTVLREVANRIEQELDEGDTVARFGGDEFNLILTDVDGNPGMSDFLNRLLTNISQPIAFGDKQIKATVSIGVSFFPTDASDAEGLLQCADSAVHMAKDFGRNSFRFFSQEQHRLIQSRYQLGNDLQAAIGNGEFQLYFQPKLDLKTNKAVGCETLLRWHHPQLGYVSPAEFIPLAEDMGLISKIGQFVIEDAVRQIAEWRTIGLEIPVAINVSAKQILQGDIAERILGALQERDVSGHLLSVELTESSFLHCLDETQQGINTLRAAGIEVAIDDFGTGYSSLSYIRNIKLDVLKIDRSFLINIVESEVDQAIVSSIIEMSHVMGLSVIAEGIETKAQRRVMKKLNCDQIQGYLVARPMPAESFLLWYQAQLKEVTEAAQSGTL
ncbi:MAG: EAL domain-containing protein [Amphritea sp.]|nr:EAL domain-containing protein [Amphritea sp.]